MFSFSKKPAVPQLPNRIWKTKTECLRGLASAAMKHTLAGGSAMVIAFFDEEAKVCTNFFGSNGIPSTVITANNIPDIAPKGIHVITAHEVVGSQHLQRTIQQTNNVLLLFRGRYPIAIPENGVLEKLPMSKGNGAFYLSMEDEFLKTFGMERMVGLMEQLGMKDDESVEHSLVDRAIANVQRKLAEKKSDHKCSSEHEWFQRNVHSRL